MARSFRRYRSDLKAEVINALQRSDTNLAAELATAVVGRTEIDTQPPKLFSVKVLHSGITAIRYDLTAALKAAVSVAGGAVGGNLIAAGIAVVGCLLALKGVRREIADELAYVLLALERRNGTATTSELLETLTSMGIQFSEHDLKERIIDLSEIGAVQAAHNVVSLQERVIVKYLEPDQRPDAQD